MLLIWRIWLGKKTSGQIFSHAHLEEMIDDIPGEELTAQVHMVHENGPATKSRLEEIKEETAKDPGLKKVRKCIIEGW